MKIVTWLAGILLLTAGCRASTSPTPQPTPTPQEPAVVAVRVDKNGVVSVAPTRITADADNTRLVTLKLTWAKDQVDQKLTLRPQSDPALEVTLGRQFTAEFTGLKVSAGAGATTTYHLRVGGKGLAAFEVISPTAPTSPTK